MKYSRFELLALTVGVVSIVGTILTTLRSGILVEEIVAQGLLLAVLVAAVHWGRKAGAEMAVLAIAIYVFMRIPMLLRDGLSMDVVGLLLVRSITYGAVGFAGGRLCSRVRYLLARLDGTSNIDEATGVFNQRFAARTVGSMIAQYERYQQTFSVATLSLPPSAAAGPGAVEDRSTLRALAKEVRSDLRLVDDVARLDDGRFLLVFPHTGKGGAQIAVDRVSKSVRRLMGARADGLHVEVLGADEDLAAIRDLCGASSGPEEGSGTLEAAA